MLDILWGMMLLIGILYGAATGNMSKVTEAALSSAKEAVSLCIAMAGIVAMWVGSPFCDFFFLKFLGSIRQWNLFQQI